MRRWEITIHSVDNWPIQQKAGKMTYASYNSNSSSPLTRKATDSKASCPQTFPQDYPESPSSSHLTTSLPFPFISRPPPSSSVSSFTVLTLLFPSSTVPPSFSPPSKSTSLLLNKLNASALTTLNFSLGTVNITCTTLLSTAASTSQSSSPSSSPSVSTTALICPGTGFLFITRPFEVPSGRGFVWIFTSSSQSFAPLCAFRNAAATLAVLLGPPLSTSTISGVSSSFVGLFCALLFSNSATRFCTPTSAVPVKTLFTPSSNPIATLPAAWPILPSLCLSAGTCRSLTGLSGG